YLHTLRSCDIPPLRFHGAPRFRGKRYAHSAKASGGEDLQVEKPGCEGVERHHRRSDYAWVRKPGQQLDNAHGYHYRAISISGRTRDEIPFRQAREARRSGVAQRWG